MPNPDVRTRFAPSPTGQLHVGGIRTLIFAYMLAKRHGGQFLLRIEDTDRERLVPEAVKAIIEDMRWLGAVPDEGASSGELLEAGYPDAESIGLAGGDFGPYIQSLKLKRYNEVAEQLIAKGAAYRCDCSAERLEQERNGRQAQGLPAGYSGYCRNRNVPKDTAHVVRFLIPDATNIVLHDEVKGSVEWHPVILRDSVILKSDGYPTYHLACVVDDYDMRISHVLRGDEWLATAPLHLLIYRALGWEPPKFAHLPPVLGSDGKKLSKRHGATFVSSFREMGYLPEALRNFIALYGWAPPGDRETDVIPFDEMIAQFSLDRVEGSGGIFSYDKLNHINGSYIRQLSARELAERVLPFLDQSRLKVDFEKLVAIAPHVQARLTVLKDIEPFIDFLFLDQLNWEINKLPDSSEQSVQILQGCTQVIDQFSNLDDTKAVEAALKELVEKLGVSAKSVFLTLRIAVTGKTITPPLPESMAVLGKNRVADRITQFIDVLKSKTR